MKQLSYLFVILSVLLCASCGNNTGKKTEKEDQAGQEKSLREQYLTAELKANLDSIVNILSTVATLPMEEAITDGNVALSDKEKRVKPDYLMPLSKAEGAITLTQKYRAVMIYHFDMLVADMYDMPTDEYKQTIANLLVNVNNPAFVRDYNKRAPEDPIAGLTEFYNTEIDNGSSYLFWEAMAAGAVEQVYILTQNFDKFLPVFDDKSVADLTFFFILIHEGITSLIPYHPEMASLNKVLEPLYLIDALTVDQFRGQLEELKDEITIVRNGLLD